MTTPPIILDFDDDAPADTVSVDWATGTETGSLTARRSTADPSQFIIERFSHQRQPPPTELRGPYRIASQDPPQFEAAGTADVIKAIEAELTVRYGQPTSCDYPGPGEGLQFTARLVTAGTPSVA